MVKPFQRKKTSQPAPSGKSSPKSPAGASQPRVQLPKPSKPKPPSLASLQILPTVTLLSLMAVIGFVTAIIGYTFGQNSLKGTTQPVVNPIFGVGGGGPQAGGAPPEQPVFRKESDVLADVKATRNGGNRPTPSPSGSPSPTGSPNPSGSPTASPTTSPSPSPSAAAAQGLPRQVTSNDISLVIRSSQRQSGDLILNVSLQNKGKRSVQFLYTFLEVTDDKGRALTAVTQGLPTELKTNSGEVAGTITIPAVALDDVKAISVSLADYPNQTLTLSIPNIAVR